MRRYETLIDAAALAQRIEEANVVVVDCRFSLADPEAGRREYEKAHIPSAVYAHLDDDLAGPVTADSGRHPLPEPAVFVDIVRGWGISNDTQVVVYDDAGGAIAARLWWMLRWLGHDAVAVLDGGFPAWEARGFATSSELPNVVTGSFSGRPDDAAVMSLTAVQRALAADGGFALVDARDAARYRGESEPIDPVAGHVPGALNLPFTAFLNAEGHFRSPDALRDTWADVIGTDRVGNWAVMCGSGVTACHLALAAKISGLADPQLYVGSWSEWVRDPARGVATGAPD